MAVLYGVGVGPGDPELLTLKAVRIIEECDVIAVPGVNARETVAYNIVAEVVEGIENKEIIGINMPMTKDEAVLKQSHNGSAELIISKLNEHRNVAFLTLGDPTIYSTFTYIQDIVEAKGYETTIINGISSIMASAALMNSRLVVQDEMLHVIPGTYGIDEALEFSGKIVIMKAGKKLKEIKEKLNGSNKDIVFIENCGMENQRVVRDIDDIPDEAGYFSMVVIFDK